MKPYFAQDDVAGALMIATIAAAVLVEWAVTLRERIAAGPGGVVGKAAGVLREVTLLRTGERREEDRGTNGWVPTIAGLAVMWAGIGLRAWAIVTLGRFFRRDVQVASDQFVVETGPYATVRHPAYAGNVLIYVGLGIALANWGSVVALAAVPLLGLLPRIRVEDDLLVERLGDPYRRYAERTPRLIPGIW